MRDKTGGLTVGPKSSWLKDALSDLDKSCERITMTFSPQDPCFRLTGEGNSGTFQV